MRSAVTIALTTLASVAPIGLAAGADPITIPISTQAELAVAGPSAFDWNGFYAGVHGGVQLGEAGSAQPALGIHAGVNAQFDFYLVGAEVAVTGLPGNDTTDETTQAQILGRAGLVVADDVLVFGVGGYGLDLGAPEGQGALLGGGVELGVSDSLSVRAQYLHSFPEQGGEGENQFTLGASIHF
jgi:outer membrane immunogenic protein